MHTVPPKEDTGFFITVAKSRGSVGRCAIFLLNLLLEFTKPKAAVHPLPLLICPNPSLNWEVNRHPYLGPVYMEASYPVD